MVMGPTHATSGAVAWLAGAGAVTTVLGYAQAPAELAVYTAVCAGAAVLPDLDVRGKVFQRRGGATAARVFGIPSLLLAAAVERLSLGVYLATRTREDPRRTNGHRTFTHTLAFALLLAGLTTVITGLVPARKWPAHPAAARVPGSRGDPPRAPRACDVHDHGRRGPQAQDRGERVSHRRIGGGLLGSDDPVTFDGRYYQLRGAILLPRPRRPGGPRILIGGNGVKRTIAYVVRYASEWNCVMLLPEDFARLSRRLDEMLLEAGRSTESVRRSMMTGCVFGKDDSSLNRKIKFYGQTLQEIQQRGVVAGSGSEIKVQLQALEEAGLQRIMLQWLDLEDLESLGRLAKIIL